jgi:hypothetical protein
VDGERVCVAHYGIFCPSSRLILCVAASVSIASSSHRGTFFNYANYHANIMSNEASWHIELVLDLGRLFFHSFVFFLSLECNNSSD